MRHSQKQISAASERASRMGKVSQRAQENRRLTHALDHRPVTSYLVLELDTHNPRTGQRHHIEIRHDPGNGNDRYSVYLDGGRWRNSWSRSRFAGWIFAQIDSVRADWT